MFYFSFSAVQEVQDLGLRTQGAIPSIPPPSLPPPRADHTCTGPLELQIGL